MAQTYPYDDEYMKYDYNKHRYILTPKCILDELNINLNERLNTRGANNKENYAQQVLDQISLQIYNFIYSHNSQWLFTQKILAKAPSARFVIKEAMKQQIMYFLMNGQIDKYSGVDLRKNTALNPNSIRGDIAIDPQAIIFLENPLQETGLSLLYRGRYMSIFANKMPNYQEENY